MGQLFLFITLCLFCFFGRVTAGDLSLFREIIKNNRGISSIESEITQLVSTNGNIPEQFKGRYLADDKGRFRIDYYKPETQIVIGNGRDLLWYYPKEKILYNMGRAVSGSAPKMNPYDEFSQNLEKRFGVEYMGTRIYSITKTAKLFLLKDRVSGVNIYLWIDKEKKVLLKKVVKDKNQRELIKEIYGNYKKIGNVYFPMKVDVTLRTPGGITRNITNYSNVRLNIKPGTRAFDIDLPADTVKKNYNED